MGSTLPLLSRLVTAAGDQVGHQVGRLYALNTLGAATGCLLAGFVSIRLLGVMGTIYGTALVNLLVALGGWKLSRAGEVLTPGKPAPLTAKNPRAASPPASQKQTNLLLGAAFVSGMISIGYELIWMRTIELPLGWNKSQSKVGRTMGMVYGFNTTGAVFGGLATGLWH